MERTRTGGLVVWMAVVGLMVVIFLLAVPGPSSGRTITVSFGGGSDYPTIGQAVVAASSGDTIQVNPGTYQESVGLKSGVVLQGSGYEDTRIEVDGLANPVYAVNSSEVEISGFTLAYTDTQSVATVFVQSSQMTITNCRMINPVVSTIYAIEGSTVTVEACVVDQGSVGIFFGGGSQGVIRASRFENSVWSGITFADSAFGEVTESWVMDNGSNGIEVNGAGPVRLVGNVVTGNTWAGIVGLEGAELDIRANTLVENGTFGVLVQSGSAATLVDNLMVRNAIGGISTQGGEAGNGIIVEIGHNDVWDNGVTTQYVGNLSNYQGLEAPSSDLSINPAFLDAAAGDYRLRSHSPLIGAASDGGAIGTLDVVSSEEENAMPSAVFIQAFPDTAYWTLIQDQAWLSVDLYLVAGSATGFAPEEVEVRFFHEDGSMVASERVQAPEFRTTSARVETDVTNLWRVWDATLTLQQAPTPLEIPPGGRASFHPREIPFSQSNLPSKAEYVVRGREENRAVEAVCEVTPTVYQQRTEYRFPLRGGGWYVLNGPPQDNHQHRGLAFAGRRMATNGRYALDIIRVYRGIYRTEGSTNADFWGHGAPVYAPAAGRVVVVVNDGEEPEVGEELPGNAGNAVVIDHQNGEYSTMVHFPKGSVVVEQGQWVEQGDLVAALGASGDRWDPPHLHFQVDNGFAWPRESLPVAFTGGRILEAEIQDGMLFTGALFEEESLGPVLRVAADGSEEYHTIGDAMAVAITGDTVRVGPGTYRESVALKSGIVLEGSGAEDTRIEVDSRANPAYAVDIDNAEIAGFELAYTGTDEVATVYVESSQVRIADCHLSNSTVSAVYVAGASAVRVEACAIERAGVGIFLTGDSEAVIHAVQIENSTWSGISFVDGSFGEVVQSRVRNNGTNGIEAIGAGLVRLVGNEVTDNAWAGVLGMEGAELEVRENTLVANGTYGVLLISASAASVFDNLVVANPFGGISTRGEEGDGLIVEIGFNNVWDNGENNYLGISVPALDRSLDPLFVDLAKSDYRLRADSPLLEAGSEGGIIGALGSADATEAPVQSELPGDFDRDGKVDFRDFFLFSEAFGRADPDFDLDGSGTVDFADFFLFVDFFGTEISE